MFNFLSVRTFCGVFSIANWLNSCTCPSTFHYSKLWCHLANSHNPFLLHFLPQAPTVQFHHMPRELPDRHFNSNSFFFILSPCSFHLTRSSMVFDNDSKNLTHKISYKNIILVSFHPQSTFKMGHSDAGQWG